MAFNAGVATIAGSAGSMCSRYLLSINLLRMANVQSALFNVLDFTISSFASNLFASLGKDHGRSQRIFAGRMLGFLAAVTLTILYTGPASIALLGLVSLVSQAVGMWFTYGLNGEAPIV